MEDTMIDKEKLESNIIPKEEIRGIGEGLEKNLEIIYLLTEGTNTEFNVKDKYFTEIIFETENGQLYIRGRVDGFIRYSLNIGRKSERRLKKEEKKGLPKQEISIKLNDVSNSFWSWSGTITKIFEKYAKNISTHKKSNIEEQIKRLITLPTTITEHLRNFEESKTKLAKQFMEENETFNQTINLPILYNQNGEKFKKIFQKLNDEQKKRVISEILQSKKINEEIDSWLGRKHPNLIKYTGRDRVEQKMEEDKK